MNTIERRAAIIEVTPHIFLHLRVGTIRLQQGVRMAAHVEELERDVVTIRVEGDGLPAKFAVRDGQRFARAGSRERIVDGITYLWIEDI